MGIKILFYILFMISLGHSSISKSVNNKKPSGLTLNLIHRDSIESNNLTRIEKFGKMIHRSHMRANHLMSYSTASTSQHHPAFLYQSSNYLVVLSVGTPPSEDSQYLILDTAAELTWLQCDGCIGCFNQKERLYDPHHSDTYKLLPCDHPLCVSYECNHDHCKFKEWDSPNVHVEGFMGTDSFGFTGNVSGGQVHTVLNDVVFGCAYGTVGFGIRDNPDNDINGVFALGPGPRSFTSQFAPQQRFAYCLADWHFGPPQYPGKLELGDEALLSVSGYVQTTPIVETDARRYFLKLADIQIDSKCLGIERGKFDRVSGQGGFIIDSGTAISFFTNEVYDSLRSNFLAYMKDLGLSEMDATPYHLDLCWHMPNGFPIPGKLPSMILYLQDNEYPDTAADCFNQAGAQLVIDPLGLFFIEEKEDPRLCLGIMRNNGTDPALNILGAKQQTNNKFSFDGTNKTLSWRKWGC
ncbi:aspartic proteinase nepenthesin-1-like [Papaver somniferum]|uniref:aspartic proteinase nepenthesin-1-like n=1 Tax=Papaver somniferum TaxID=3469 RepID=UPI000E6FA19E|nr:aspartic proteinase nepenthesin-1-like [Papaver somniferum]